MAFVTGTPSRTAVAPRPDGLIVPEVTGREVRFDHPACPTCPKQTDHGSPCVQIGILAQHGTTKDGFIPEASRIDEPFLRRLQSDFFRMGAVANGPVGLEFIYNLGLGLANNMMQNFTYEVLQVDSNNIRRVQLRGPDPRALPVGRSRENPDWPFEGGRLITETLGYRLPVGSFLLPDYPSAMYRRATPWIESWEAPSGTLGGEKTFWAILSRSVKNIREPFDAGFPASRYTCTVLAYILAPEGWENLQGTGPETTFAEQTLPFVAGDLVGGKLELTNGTGDPCRVALSPDMGSNLIRIALLWDGDSETTPVSIPPALVSTEDTGTGWRTFVDLTGYLDKPGTLDPLVSGVARYWAESVAGDSQPLIYARRRCMNSQKDGNGTFDCMAKDCTKFVRGDYRAECWESTDLASRFTLRNPALAVGDLTRSQWGKYWSRESLALIQGQAGVSSSRNFAFFRPPGGGPSIQQLWGGFVERLPSGPGNSTRESWDGPKLGQRREFEEGGMLKQELIHGAYWTSRTGFNGALAALLGGTWTSKLNARGVASDAVNGLYPTFHGPPMFLGSRNTGSDPAASIKLARAQTQVLHVTGLDPEGVNGALASSIRSKIP